MILILHSLALSLLGALRSRRTMALRILVLEHQVRVLKRRGKRPRLTDWDRAFWLAISRTWSQWRAHLHLVRPETVVDWHRRRFRRYWTRKSQRVRPGRPSVPVEIRQLIRKMARANSFWGAPRIHGELLKLGIEISQATVAKYMPRRSKPPSQTWRTFLNNHVGALVAIDFFTVPTATFCVLFVLVVLAHDRRRVIHFNVTQYPTAKWTGQQIAEAFPWDTAPRFLLRDRDGIYGRDFVRRAASMDIEQVVISARSPWQNPYVERSIGSIRRECLDHVIVFNDTHLRRILSRYFRYHHTARTHLELAKDTPLARQVQSPAMGMVVEFPEVGGLHHRYERRAA